VSHDGSQEAPQASAGLLPSIPAMPSFPRAGVYRGTPRLLLESGVRHSLGWQDDRKAGLSFVVVRVSGWDRIKVNERFPLTEQGWAAAWRALSGLDVEAAAAVGTRLGQIEAGRQSAAALVALNAESLHCLRRVTFNGGSGRGPLTKGRAYDVRFLGDRIMVCLPDSAAAIVEVPYRDVETVEVSGSSPGKSPGEVLAWILALGLVGALLGLLVLGLLGFLLGAVVFGVAGALVGAAWSNIQTIVRLRGRDAEFFFVIPAKPADALRIELSEPLRVIENTRAAQAADSDERTDLSSGSIPDQLSKLASLLQQGLITRDEFEHLKSKLIAES
jgi:Short C-terminal domain